MGILSPTCTAAGGEGARECKIEMYSISLVLMFENSIQSRIGIEIGKGYFRWKPQDFVSEFKWQEVTPRHNDNLFVFSFQSAVSVLDFFKLKQKTRLKCISIRYSRTVSFFIYFPPFFSPVVLDRTARKGLWKYCITAHLKAHYHFYSFSS